MRKQLVKEIYGEFLSENNSSGTIAYFKNFEFKDLINWVWRNCQGCDHIEIYPENRVVAIFEDRVETYKLNEKEIPASIPLER